MGGLAFFAFERRAPFLLSSVIDRFLKLYPLFFKLYPLSLLFYLKFLPLHLQLLLLQFKSLTL